MGVRVTGQRIRVGVDVVVVSQDEVGVELEGSTRLIPGRLVELVCAGIGRPILRRALVWSWRLIRLDGRGAMYRGYCRWTPLLRTDPPAPHPTPARWNDGPGSDPL